MIFMKNQVNKIANLFKPKCKSSYKYIIKKVKKQLPNIIDDNYVNNREKFSGNRGGYTLEYGWSLCGQDLTKTDMTDLSTENFTKLSFDENTKFSKSQLDKFKPWEILEKGKHFGLNLDKIKEAKINGSGINIAVIDCPFDIQNPEMLDENGKNKVIHYDDSAISSKNRNYDGFHGKTVTSLLVGTNVGIAPNCNIYYFAGSEDPTDLELSNVLDKIKKLNEDGANIKAISMSGSFREDEINDKYTEELKKQDCAFISATNFFNIGNFSYLNRNVLKNVDDIDTYTKGHEFSKSSVRRKKEMTDEEYLKYMDYKEEKHKNAINIPTSGRTYPQISNGYIYCGSSSASWSIPQAAGLFALAKQLDSNISFEEFTQICATTASKSKNGYNVINPEGLLRQINEQNKTKSRVDKDYIEIYSKSSKLISNLDRIIEQESTFKEELKSKTNLSLDELSVFGKSREKSKEKCEIRN